MSEPWVSESGHSGLVASGGHNKSLHTWWFETTEPYSVAVLEAPSPRSSCWWPFPLKALGKHTSCSLTASGGLLAILDVACFVRAQLLSLHMTFFPVSPLSLCVQISVFI